VAAVKIGDSMYSCEQSQHPSEPKADEKHQCLAKALDELLSKTPFGALFADALVYVKGGKHRASLANQISCKLQGLINNSMKIPRKFNHLFWNRPVSLWRKRHFFKTLTTAGKVFPPTGYIRQIREIK
jgi:hypothetical protein